MPSLLVTESLMWPLSHFLDVLEGLKQTFGSHGCASACKWTAWQLTLAGSSPGKRVLLSRCYLVLLQVKHLKQHFERDALSRPSFRTFIIIHCWTSLLRLRGKRPSKTTIGFGPNYREKGTNVHGPDRRETDEAIRSILCMAAASDFSLKRFCIWFRDTLATP